MNTISGLSFYDSLNKMIIGTLVLLLVKDMPSEDDGKSIFLFIVAAFITGCVFQMIVQFITGGTVLGEVIKNGFFKSSNQISAELNWTNNINMIKKAHCDFYKTFREMPDIKIFYLKAYYNVARNGLLMNIPVLEALETFMRNLIFYFLILFVLSLGNLLPILPCLIFFVIFQHSIFLPMSSCGHIFGLLSCVVILWSLFLYIVYLSIFLCVLFLSVLLFIALLLILFDYILGDIFVWGAFLGEILQYGKNLKISSIINIDNSIIGFICDNDFLQILLCVISLFVVYWLRKETQYKIHYLIWEGDYYIRRLDKERNKA